MRKKSIILAVLGVAVLGGLFWLVLRPREPVYQGRRLSYWLEVYDYTIYQPVGTARFAMAKEALRQAGTNAIPVLLRMLRAHDSALKFKLMALAGRQHIVNIRFTSADSKNYEARRAFFDLGTNALQAVPALIEIYRRNYSTFSKTCAAETLVEMRPAAKEAIPAFVIDVTNVDSRNDFRGTAIEMLGAIHTDPELAVPALIKCLQDRDPIIQELAARALGRFGKDAMPAVPELVKLAKPQYPYSSTLQSTVADAVKLIDPEAAANLPADTDVVK